MVLALQKEIGDHSNDCDSSTGRRHPARQSDKVSHEPLVLRPECHSAFWQRVQAPGLLPASFLGSSPALAQTASNLGAKVIIKSSF
jgi:hypothetical protein